MNTESPPSTDWTAAAAVVEEHWGTVEEHWGTGSLHSYVMKMANHLT